VLALGLEAGVVRAHGQPRLARSGRFALLVPEPRLSYASTPLGHSVQHER
jgi:hypothetical protein